MKQAKRERMDKAFSYIIHHTHVIKDPHGGAQLTRGYAHKHNQWSNFNRQAKRNNAQSSGGNQENK